MSISIVIPVHNNQSTLFRCVSSIISQPSSNELEIICVDDHSTDKSSQEIPSDWVTWINSNGHGVSSARNTGLVNSTNPFIWFIDADDWLMPNVINERFIKLIKKYDSDQYLIGVNKINNGSSQTLKNNSLRTYTKKDGARIFSENILNCVWNKIYKTKFLKDNQIVFQPFSMGEDALFNYSVLNHVGSLTTIPKVVYCFDTRSNTSSKTKWKQDQMTSSIIMTQELKKLHDTTTFISDDELSRELVELLISNEVNYLARSKTTFQNYVLALDNKSMKMIKKEARQTLTRRKIPRYLFASSKIISYFYLKKRFFSNGGL